MTNYSSPLLFMVDAFNEHIALDQWKVHTVQMRPRLASTADVTATASADRRVWMTSGKYNAHRILTAGPSTSGRQHARHDHVYHIVR